MNIIINEHFNVVLAGFAGTAQHGGWAKTGFTLMDKIWQQLKVSPIKNKGKNIWVYEEHNAMFAGIELDEAPPHDTNFETKEIHLAKYAYYKHTGAYNKIAETGTAVLAHLNSSGIHTRLPYIEIYGHWEQDEEKLETELIWALE